VAQPWEEIEYAHNNLLCIVLVPHLSEWIHFICAKSKLDISWIIREHTPTICRVSNLSIRLAIHMPKQQLKIPWVGKHTLQVVNHKYVPHHKGENCSLVRPLNVLIGSDILHLSPLPFIALFVGVILNLLNVIVSFLSTSIAHWTPTFEFMFFCIRCNGSSSH
jgi:hypothetical protein